MRRVGVFCLIFFCAVSWATSVFARVVEGLDIAAAISSASATPAGIAAERITINKITIREKTPTVEQMKSMKANIETSLGTISLQLLPDTVPNTARHFVRYARSGSYDGTTFFRVSQKYFLEAGYPGDWPQDSANRKRVFSGDKPKQRIEIKKITVQ